MGGRSAEPGPCWSGRDLARFRILLVAVAAFAVAAPVAAVTSCNVHELAHAAVGTSLGWEVERVNPCWPGGGSVEYARVGRWFANAQGYAGGLGAAGFLVAAYLWGFARRARPLRSPAWWAAGMGVSVWVGPQVMIGVLEGLAGPGEDYTERFAEAPAVTVALLGLAMIAGAAAHVWRWRSVWGDASVTARRP